MTFKTFAFFGDIIDFQEKNTFDISSEFQIARAEGETLNIIQEHIKQFHQYTFRNINRYEIARTDTLEGVNINMSYEKLQPENWRYSIVKHKIPPINRKIPLTFGLSELDLTTIFQGGLPESGVGLGYQLLTASNFYYDTYWDRTPIKTITIENLEEIAQLSISLDRFDQIKSDYEIIDKALNDFLKLEEISKTSPFKILSHFSILELLLTTFKKNDNSSKSLRSQLQHKIDLINNQSNNPISIKDHFTGPDTLDISNVIGKLYEYRNDIAHGNKSDFDNDLQILKGKDENILKFLRAILKNTLSLALTNPKLISDLKKC